MSSASTRPSPERSVRALSRLNNSRNALGLLFMLPAAVFLLGFLTYPLGLGVWLGFTQWSQIAGFGGGAGYPGARACAGGSCAHARVLLAARFPRSLCQS